MIYLASPYSHEDPRVRDQRFDEVSAAAAALMARGVQLFCPISHTHPIAVMGDLPKGFEFWETYDRWFLERCDAIVIAKINGWRQSKGVTAEREIAAELGLPDVAYDRGGHPTWDLAADKVVSILDGLDD